MWMSLLRPALALDLALALELALALVQELAITCSPTLVLELAFELFPSNELSSAF